MANLHYHPAERVLLAFVLITTPSDVLLLSATEVRSELESDLESAVESAIDTLTAFESTEEILSITPAPRDNAAELELDA